MQLEFDWSFNVDCPRLGDAFTGVNGWHARSTKTSAYRALRRLIHALLRGRE